MQLFLFYLTSLFNIDVENRTYNAHFDKEPQEIVFYYHKGGQQIESERYKTNINAVLSHLDFVPNDKRIVNLVWETSITESFGGKYVKQIKGSAYGIYQIEMATYNCLVSWLERRKIKDQVFAFYDKNSTLEKNLKNNVPFTTALCIAHYYRYYGDDLPCKANNILNRAKMWKVRYNTKHGKGSVKGYIKKVVKYGYLQKLL